MLNWLKTIFYLFIVFTTIINNITIAKSSDKELDAISKQEIIDRLSPLTQTCKQGDPCAKLSSSILETPTSGSRTAEDIYKKSCAMCHTSGLLGAPKKGNNEDWKKHLSNHNGSFNEMLQSAIKGIGAMPPRGNCVDCSDDEIKLTIEFMSNLKP